MLAHSLKVEAAVWLNGRSRIYNMRKLMVATPRELYAYPRLLCGFMLQFAVGFVITPSCRGGRSKPKMGCRPSQKQNNAKKQVPSP